MTRTTHDAFLGDDQLELDLNAVLLTVWARRWILLAVTALFGLMGLALTWGQEPEYWATAKLRVMHSRLADGGLAMPVEGYRPFIENNGIAADVITALSLNVPPHVLKPQTLLEEHLVVRALQDSGVLTIQSRMWTAQLAANVANRVARSAVELSRQTNAQELANATSLLEEQMQRAQKRMLDLEAALTKAKQDSGVDLLQADVDTRLNLRKELLHLTTSIQAESARLAHAREELTKQEKVRESPRAVQETVGRPDPATSLTLRPEVFSPYINPVYDSLNMQIAESATTLAGLEKRRSELVEVLHLNESNDPRVRALYGLRASIDALQREYGIARDAYVTMAGRSHQLTLQISGRADELRLLDTAETPLRPVPTHWLRTSIVWAGVGFLTACVWALLSRGLSRARSGDAPAAFAVSPGRRAQ